MFNKFYTGFHMLLALWPTGERTKGKEKITQQKLQQTDRMAWMRDIFNTA